MPYHLLWPELGSQQHYFGHILFMEIVTKALPSARGGETDSSSVSSGKVLEEHVGPQLLLWPFFGKYNVSQSPRSEKPRSYLFPGEEMKKFGQVQIPSIHSCN